MLWIFSECFEKDFVILNSSWITERAFADKINKKWLWKIVWMFCLPFSGCPGALQFFSIFPYLWAYCDIAIVYMHHNKTTTSTIGWMHSIGCVWNEPLLISIPRACVYFLHSIAGYLICGQLNDGLVLAIRSMPGVNLPSMICNSIQRKYYYIHAIREHTRMAECWWFRERAFVWQQHRA